MVEAGFIALFINNRALLLASSVDYHTWHIYQQLDGLVSFRFVGVVTSLTH